ncbi:MAG: 7,8-didemethyl-8-hydroxy-5-deazariboflavin synthase subunit CofG [Spirulinaceae cyanobacterium SM2_1_0]|nr:7,8-didemethyl-8-hydroxy-5-deazariboflavin synthase subunit CofG [Spirulinaceae cyanobacterium SM2_1_0]
MPITLTYSPAYTLVPTYECFNRCSYCNFRRDPGTDPWLTLTEAETRLRALQGSGVVEILILSGEVHPQSPRRAAWGQHLYDLADLALRLGFLPHTNAGPLSRAEMAQLQTVNVSMGLMLEQLTPALLATVHRHAPSKLPELRLQQLHQAGELGIPFTTGLLLGIGETVADWEASLGAIATCQQRWGHIQEVILQPHSPGTQQAEWGQALAGDRLLAATHLARQCLPPEVAIQIPPNLVAKPEQLQACVAAGARDLGGLSPKDEVNPDYPHPTPVRLAHTLAPDYELVPRLPVYPQYISRLPERLQRAIASRSTGASSSQQLIHTNAETQ